MSWSYSKLTDFEQCRYRYKLRYVDKVATVSHAAADRGTAIHTKAEEFVLDKLTTLPAELNKFADEFTALKARMNTGLASLEGEWAFDTDWMPTAYAAGWLRMKADAVVFNKEKTTALVIDYKTGKKFGNEIKHGEQVQLYALATAIREPTVEDLKVELWYLDQDELTATHYTRAQALKFVKLFDARATKIDAAHANDAFPPNPNVFSCQYCPYSPKKTGQCQHGITSASMSITDYRRKFL